MDFVSRDLDIGVRGGVENGLADGDMFNVELLDYLHARSMFVANYARQAEALDYVVDQAVGKGHNLVQEIVEVPAERCSGNLPMAQCRVLAFGAFYPNAPCAGYRLA